MLLSQMKDLKRIVYIAFFRLKVRYHYSVIGPLIEPLTTTIWIGALLILFGQSRDILYVGTGVVIFRFLSELIGNATFLKTRLLKLILNFGSGNTLVFYRASFFENILLFNLNLLVLGPIVFLSNKMSALMAFQALVSIAFFMLIVGYAIFNIFFYISVFFQVSQTLVKPTLRLLFFASPIFWSYEPNLTDGDLSAEIRNGLYFVNPMSWLMETSRFLLGYKNPITLHLLGVIFVGFIAMLISIRKNHTIKKMKMISWQK